MRFVALIMYKFAHPDKITWEEDRDATLNGKLSKDVWSSVT